MTISMTGFASRKGAGQGYAWSWDLRSVNGKGLDLRLRLPDWVEGLETALRAEMTHALQRGNVSLSLKLAREGVEAGAFAVNQGALSAALQAISDIEQLAMARGVSLRSATTAEILALRGITDNAAVEPESTETLRRAVMADFAGLLADFQSMRAAEGHAGGAPLPKRLCVYAHSSYKGINHGCRLALAPGRRRRGLPAAAPTL